MNTFIRGSPFFRSYKLLKVVRFLLAHPHGRPQDFSGVGNEGVWRTEVPPWGPEAKPLLGQKLTTFSQNNAWILRLPETLDNICSIKSTLQHLQWGMCPPLPMPAGARAHPVFIDFLLGRNKYVFCSFTDALSMVACHDLANGVLPTVRYLTEEPNNLFPYLCI